MRIAKDFQLWRYRRLVTKVAIVRKLDDLQILIVKFVTTLVAHHHPYLGFH